KGGVRLRWWLEISESELDPPFSYAGEDRRFLRIIRRQPQNRAAQDDGRHERGSDEPAPELLHQQSKIGVRSAEAAMLFGQGRGQPAQLRELRPDRIVPGAELGEQRLALLERITLLAKAFEAFLQQPLFFGEGGQHD